MLQASVGFVTISIQLNTWPWIILKHVLVIAPFRSEIFTELKEDYFAPLFR